MAVQQCMAICVLQKHKMESKNEPILKLRQYISIRAKSLWSTRGRKEKG